MRARRVSEDTLDSSMSDVSGADGEPLSPLLQAALARLASTDAPTADRPPAAAFSAMAFTVETFTVEPDPESVTAARHFTVATLKTWGL